MTIGLIEKGLTFGGLIFKNRGQLGSRYGICTLYLYPKLSLEHFFMPFRRVLFSTPTQWQMDRKHRQITNMDIYPHTCRPSRLIVRSIRSGDGKIDCNVSLLGAKISTHLSFQSYSIDPSLLPVCLFFGHLHSISILLGLGGQASHKTCWNAWSPINLNPKGPKKKTQGLNSTPWSIASKEDRPNICTICVYKNTHLFII